MLPVLMALPNVGIDDMKASLRNVGIANTVDPVRELGGRLRRRRVPDEVPESNGTDRLFLKGYANHDIVVIPRFSVMTALAMKKPLTSKKS